MLFKDYFELFISCLITSFVTLSITRKILGLSINYKKIKFYLFWFLLTIATFINYLLVTNFIRILTSTIIIIFFTNFLFKVDKEKIIISVILEQIILFISELLYMIILLFIFDMNEIYLLNEVKGSILTTLVICGISILLVNLKFVKNFIKMFFNYMLKIQKNIKYIFILLFLITINILLFLIYLNFENIEIVIINCLFIIIYSYILYLLLSEKNKNIVFKEENESLLENLNEYEKMLDYQRVSNHENKNQLLVIKTLINKKNKKAIDYLDEIITEKRQDDEGLFAKAKRIPTGGLQGLIYQKMLVMQEKNINIDLDVSRDVRKINFDNMTPKMNYDICRIVGIIIDNAIDEVLKLDKKSISIYLNNVDSELEIAVLNQFKDIPDLEKIYEKGYTTKENGHGYGLSLLKEIVDKNEKLYNEHDITKNIFKQIIKIKM